MVPELERVTAFLGARLVLDEVEDSLGEMLSEPPSRTAIQHVLTTVGHRLKRSGMRWTRQGGQQILNLRVQVQSKGWDVFWDWYLDQTTTKIAA